jgi:hypothetical protein
VLSCAQPKALQRICDGLDDKKIERLLRKSYFPQVAERICA